VLNEAQLRLFLTRAARDIPRAYPALLTCAYGGLRIGESRGLRTTDVNFRKHTLTISRSISEKNVVGPPKSGEPRTVDMTASLMRLLPPLCTRPGWIVPDGSGERPFSYFEIRRSMRRVLKASGLPAHLSPHSLRHGYASILVSRGLSLEYVRRQMGHASVRMVAELYGRHLPFPRPRLLDRL
jgi:integrase